MEQDLYNIAAKHRVSVDTIVDLVNENEAVLNEIKFNMKQMFVQSLVTVSNVEQGVLVIIL